MTPQKRTVREVEFVALTIIDYQSRHEDECQVTIPAHDGGEGISILHALLVVLSNYEILDAIRHKTVAHQAVSAVMADAEQFMVRTGIRRAMECTKRNNDEE